MPLILGSLIDAQTFGAPSLLNEIDSLITKHQLNEAQEKIRLGLKDKNNDYELLCRASRVLLFLADLKTDKKEQLNIYNEAMSFAEQAIASRPDGMNGYIRRAAANGKLALFKGILGARESVLQVKKDAEKAIELKNDTAESLALANYILGRTHLKLTETPKVVRNTMGLGWGTLEDSIKLLETSLSLHPKMLKSKLELSKAYLKATRKQDAKKQLLEIASMQEIEFGDDLVKKESEAFLKTIN
ncbi:MAG: hypothetical protein KA715_03660 [Xanthomonadaceae bacterium]|nr:hypothetical protein [Xanthomonadaceae bacterium]